MPNDAPYSDEKLAAGEKNYAAMITRLDADIGKLIEALKDLDLDENTIVFFSSDNGPHKEGGHDPTFFHSSRPAARLSSVDLHEGGVRVPMIVRWPGKVQAGTDSDQVWAFWDFLPTAADLAGVQAAGRPRWHLAGADAARARASSSSTNSCTGSSTRAASSRRCGWATGRRPRQVRRPAGAVRPEERHWRDARRGRRACRRGRPRLKST